MPRDLGGRLVAVLRPPRQCPSPRHRVLAAAVTALGGLALALNVSQSAGLWDRVVVVAFLLAAPTAALVRLLPGLGLALALLVGGAGAVAVNALIAQTMLSADVWSPFGGVVAVALAVGLLWLLPGGRSDIDRPDTGDGLRPPCLPG
ncbi:hypothetical protein [Rhodococcus rhodochrous]|uniref:hypothetical protein n=1 Tax=Rhodococcus rhodochrous TaxID=1829 RepID=UPI0012FD25B3|nr:hypothetical protein [Rhodococcus rhodochrous]